MSDGRSTTGADSTEILDAIARESKVTLYKRFTEAEAAAILDVSVPTLRRIRERGEIAYIRISDRVIRYFGLHLCEYLLSQVQTIEREAQWPSQTDIKSANTGSASKPEVRIGAERGMITEQDRQNALASARRILKRPNKT